MKTLLGLGISLFLFTTFALAQPEPLTLWQYYYGDSCLGVWDDLWSCQKTTDGGFIFTGSTVRYSPGSVRMWLVKTDSAGNMLWDRGYGSRVCYGKKVLQTADGGFLLAGSGEAPSSPLVVVTLLKVDANGDSLWMRQYGNPICSAYNMIQTRDGNFVLAGYVSDDIYVIKVDGDGNLLWEHRYITPEYETVFDLVETDDDGLLVVGYRTTSESAEKDLIILRTDSEGDSLWLRHYDQPNDEDSQFPASIGLLADGSFLISGTDLPPFTHDDNLFLTHISSAGNMLWFRLIGRADSLENGGWMTMLPDGILLSGDTGTYENDVRVAYLVKTDYDGRELWHRTWSLRDVAFMREAIPLADGRLLLPGQASCFYGNQIMPPDAFLLCTGPDGVPVDDPSILQPSSFSLSAFPNPFNATTMMSFTLPKTSEVKMAVYDVLGREVNGSLGYHTGSPLQAGEHHITFDGSDLASGVYFLRMEADQAVHMQKLLLLK